MPVYVNDLVTEVTVDEDTTAEPREDAADGTPAAGGGDELRYAYERLMRDLHRTRAERFSD